MIFLQTQPQGAGIANLIFIGSIFAIVYLFFLRPSVKKQKEQAAFSEELTKGQEVVTTSGIIGRVNKIENGIVQLQIDQKTFMRVVAAAISKEMTENLHKPDKKA